MADKRKILLRLAVLCCVLLLLSACIGRSIVDQTTKETGLQSSIVLDANGVPMMAYFDKTERMVRLAVCANAHCKTAEIVVVDNEGATGQYPSMTLNAQGHPVISYYDMTKKSLKLSVCQDLACSDVRRVLLDDPDSEKFGEYSSLKLNAAGHPVISYYDADKRNLKLIVCHDPLCASYDNILVDGAQKVGKSTSLQLAVGDHPVISYFDEDNGYLKVAICQDALCSDPVLRTFVSGEAEAGEFNALALNAKGHPVISYQEHDSTTDPAMDSLKVVVCQDPLCQGAVSNTVDKRKGALLGTYNSMVLNSKGHPVIAYWDAELHAVKIARCRDETCTRVARSRVGFDWGLQFTAIVADENDKVYVSCAEVRPNKTRLVLIRPLFP